MLPATDRITLRNGETAEFALVRAPDPAWAERVERMLLHKGEPWIWQNSGLLRAPTGADASFFVLHQAGEPFANIMLMRSGPVGLLGHVWTEPRHRGAGASSALLERVLGEFAERGGRAMFLGTEAGGLAWDYYRRRGFAPIEADSGYMERHADSRAAFAAAWFDAVTDAVVEPLDWPHLVAAAPLFLGDFPGTVRIASARLFGRCVGDEALLPILRESRDRRARGLPPSACVLRDANGRAVVGLACWRPHPLWAPHVTLDLYCHPGWWHRAPDLLQALRLPAGTGAIAYADTTHAAKRHALAEAGFTAGGVLPRLVATRPRCDPIDVAVYCRR